MAVFTAKTSSTAVIILNSSLAKPRGPCAQTLLDKLVCAPQLPPVWGVERALFAGVPA